MANVKVIEKKAEVVSEIKNNIENAKSVVLFDYRGLTDSEIKELRNKLRHNNASYKVYKNTHIRKHNSFHKYLMHFFSTINNPYCY